MLNVVEAFSGIGSQAQALKNANIEHTVSAIVEWEVSAMYAYDIIHNGAQSLKDYRFHTKESLSKEVSKYNISVDGKSKASEKSIARLSMMQLKAIYASIERTNNLVDISEVKAEEFPNDIDVLTYSFPCQDLSVAGNWHNNSGGIEKSANNRSVLLWQIERLLKEYCNIGKELPKFLLMENVSSITSKRHINNFETWKSFLEKLGYMNIVYTLNSKNFGIPQSRQRVYMISILVKEDSKKKNAVEKYFFENNLENIYLEQKNISPMENYLRLDYANSDYKMEAIASTPNYTPSRERIHKTNRILAIDDKVIDNVIASTITTKQDRHPNSGIIEYNKIKLVEEGRYRNLTPRECFLLMGFDEKSYELLINNNFEVGKNRTILSFAKLYKLSGNSIVVPVLEEIFKQIDTINKKVFNSEELFYPLIYKIID